MYTGAVYACVHVCICTQGLYLRVYMNVCACTCMYMYTGALYVNVRKCVCTGAMYSICLSMYGHVHRGYAQYAYVHVCMCMYMHVCAVYACVHMCICTQGLYSVCACTCIQGLCMQMYVYRGYVQHVYVHVWPCTQGLCTVMHMYMYVYVCTCMYILVI